jgi:hypothetical protein
MTKWLVVFVLAFLVAGCGNVYLQGDAMTAVESSTLDAYGFYQRVDGNALPFVKAYAAENVQQWRWFARSAKNDLAWGPKLPGDANQ